MVGICLLASSFFFLLFDWGFIYGNQAIFYEIM